MYVKLRMLLLLILRQFFADYMAHLCCCQAGFNAVIMASTCAFFYIPGILP